MPHPKEPMVTEIKCDCWKGIAALVGIAVIVCVMGPFLYGRNDGYTAPVPQPISEVQWQELVRKKPGDGVLDPATVRQQKLERWVP